MYQHNFNKSGPTSPIGGNMGPMTGLAIGSAVAGAAGNIFSGIGAKKRQAEQNKVNLLMQMQNQRWQEEMSNTAYQRSTADMQKAGLNPKMMYGGSAGQMASTPSGGVNQGAPYQESQALPNIIRDITGLINSVTQRKDVDSKITERQQNIKESNQRITNLVQQIDESDQKIELSKDQQKEIDKRIDVLKKQANYIGKQASLVEEEIKFTDEKRKHLTNQAKVFQEEMEYHIRSAKTAKTYAEYDQHFQRAEKAARLGIDLFNAAKPWNTGSTTKETQSWSEKGGFSKKRETTYKE